MPDVEFVDLVRSKHNIFSGNDNKKYDAYLTTVVNSDYQSLLVSAAVEEIPIVAIPEGVGRGLLSSSNSWLLDVNLSEESIISAIRCCQLNTEITREKTKVAKSDAFSRHSWEEFSSNISSVGLLSVSRKKEMNR